MPESSPDPSIPPAFLIVVFAVAILIGALVAYFGITGHLGAGIP